jgi:hypothetical protein
MTHMVDDQKQRHRYPNREEQVAISVHRHSHTPNATPQPENEAKEPLLLHLGDAIKLSKASVGDRCAKLRSCIFTPLSFMLVAASDRNFEDSLPVAGIYSN